MKVETTTSWGVNLRLGFVADFSAGNEVGIAEKICVGYKGEFQFPRSAVTPA